MHGERSGQNHKLGSCHFTFGFCADNPTFGRRNPAKLIGACRQPPPMLGGDLSVANREPKSQRQNETSRIREQMQSVIVEKWLVPEPKQIGPVLIE